MSNSRAFRRRVAQQKLARNDGRVIHVAACCNLELEVSPGRLNARHDANCPALRPHTPEGMTARLRANQAVTQALTELGIDTVAVIA